jgi:hypothetical protein
LLLDRTGLNCIVSGKKVNKGRRNVTMVCMGDWGAGAIVGKKFLACFSKLWAMLQRISSISSILFLNQLNLMSRLTAVGVVACVGTAC